MAEVPVWAFRLLSRPLTVACLLCDHDGRILAANPSARHLLGGEQVDGTYLADWLSDDASRLMAFLGNAAHSTQRTPARLHLERGGVVTPLRVYGARIPWENGGYGLHLQLEPLDSRHNAFRLLTKQIEALQAREARLARDKAELEEIIARRTRDLAKREHLQRVLLDTVDQAIIAIDEKGRIQTFNRAAEVMFGYPAEALIGEPVTLLMDRPHAARHRAALRRYLGGGRPRILGRGIVEVTGRHRDGTVIPVELSLAEVEGEEHLRFVAALRDIRERKRQEEAIRDHMKALERINRELDQFAYVASHDLKAPLRAIANLAEWIEEDLEGCLKGETRRQFELLRGRVRRMEALIDGLLAYSRAGRSELHVEAVDVGGLLAEVVDSLDPPDGMRIEGRDLPTLTTDRLRLSQVLANLVGNAIKYHHDPSHGRVLVSGEDLGDWVRFTVADDGPGIDPRFHERIFQIFQTLQSRDTMESTGIGLALVKKIVEEMGGGIELQSAPGEGASFRFTWPKGEK